MLQLFLFLFSFFFSPWVSFFFPAFSGFSFFFLSFFVFLFFVSVCVPSFLSSFAFCSLGKEGREGEGGSGLLARASVGRSAVRSVGRLVRWLICGTIDRSVGRWVGRSVLLVGQPVGSILLVDGETGRSVGWSVCHVRFLLPQLLPLCPRPRSRRRRSRRGEERRGGGGSLIFL